MKCKHGVSIILVGFARKWHRSSVHWTQRGSRGGKPVLNYYGYHDDSTFCSGKTSQLTELVEKRHIHKRKKFVCLTCGRGTIQLITKATEINNCEFCDN